MTNATRYSGAKFWLLMTRSDGCAAIQTNDALCHRFPHVMKPGDDDAAVRRARLEARKGRRWAIEALAICRRERRHHG